MEANYIKGKHLCTNCDCRFDGHVITNFEDKFTFCSRRCFNRFYRKHPAEALATRIINGCGSDDEVLKQYYSLYPPERQP